MKLVDNQGVGGGGKKDELVFSLREMEPRQHNRKKEMCNLSRGGRGRPGGFLPGPVPFIN